MIAINSAALEPVMKRAYAFSRTAYETAAETNDEVKRVFEKQSAELNRPPSPRWKRRSSTRPPAPRPSSRT